MPGTFRISGGEITLPSGVILNDAINSAAAIDVDKLRQMHKFETNFGLAIGATAVAREDIVFVAKGSGIIRGFHALLNVTGTSTLDVSFDLKKNGTTILSSLITIEAVDAASNPTSDGQVKDGIFTATGASYVTDDIFSIELTVVSSTGASGPLAWIDVEQGP